MLNTDDIEKLDSKCLVQHYLMSSYAYGFLNRTYMDDHAYDRLCKRLQDEFDSIEHRHKSLIDKDALSATTGYYIREENYPEIVKIAARNLVEK